jgi:ArsR family metal-binding transcriptional regulator
VLGHGTKSRRRQEKHRLLEELPKKDCAACGAPDCTTLAEDILAGQAKLEDCVFVRLRAHDARGT